MWTMVCACSASVGAATAMLCRFTANSTRVSHPGREFGKKERIGLIVSRLSAHSMRSRSCLSYSLCAADLAMSPRHRSQEIRWFSINEEGDHREEMEWAYPSR